MAKQIYTLRENEKELFVLRADSIVMPGSAASFISSLLASQRNFLRSLPLIGCCCGKGYVDIVATDQRILVVHHDTCFCLHEEVTVTSLSNKVLDGYNSFEYSKKNLCICCCAKTGYRFSIGMCRGAVASSITFTTSSVTTPEEAAAVVAKFDEIASRK